MKKNFYIGLFYLCAVFLVSCGGKKQSVNTPEEDNSTVVPDFNADSALAHVFTQCHFGPRVVGSEAHNACGEFLIDKFRQYGFNVSKQEAEFMRYDGVKMKGYNIIAQLNSKAPSRILIAAHWDSRPWADNDPDSTNWRKPVMAANDGASGVAVMLEIARQLQADKKLNPNIGVDFVCFDTEDWGTPQWADVQDDGDTWALGAQYWSENKPEGYNPRFGILLDMVGGQGAKFYREGMSMQYAGGIVKKVWAAARQAGFGSYFPKSDGGMITDDHIPVNEKAKIPTVDVIAYYPDCQQSSFGPTWHTVSDDMAHLDKNVLKAVGQTMIQVLYTEE